MQFGWSLPLSVAALMVGLFGVVRVLLCVLLFRFLLSSFFLRFLFFYAFLSSAHILFIASPGLDCIVVRFFNAMGSPFVSKKRLYVMVMNVSIDDRVVL